eukprot:1467321-Prorocentrum_lima.AAC.1
MAPSMLVIRQGSCVIYVNDRTLAMEWLDKMLTQPSTERKERVTPPPAPTAEATSQTPPPKCKQVLLQGEAWEPLTEKKVRWQ